MQSNQTSSRYQTALLVALLLTALQCVTTVQVQGAEAFGGVVRTDSTDQVKYKILYETTFVYDHAEPERNSDKGLSLLLVGESAVLFEDYVAYQADSLWNDLRKKGAREEVIRERCEEQLSSAVTPFVSLSLLEEKRHIMQYDLSMAGAYRYEEPLPNQKWEITGETAEKAGFRATKAVTTFRGRKWEAWFSEEIPLPYGPYVFGGLPGLIVEMSDSTGTYLYRLSGILEPYPTELPIGLRHLPNIQTLPREKVRTVVENCHKDFFTAMGIIFNGGRDKIKVEIPYSPIELE